MKFGVIEVIIYICFRWPKNIYFMILEFCTRWIFCKRITLILSPLVMQMVKISKIKIYSIWIICFNIHFLNADYSNKLWNAQPSSMCSNNVVSRASPSRFTYNLLSTSLKSIFLILLDIFDISLKNQNLDCFRLRHNKLS